jgi:N6-adenosine-specific RNA methylase IME4
VSDTGLTHQHIFDYGDLPSSAIKRCEVAIQKIDKYQRRMAGDVIAIGGELSEAKKALGHGNFGPWLKHHFGWSQPTASRMMQAAETFGDKLFKMNNLTIDQSALYLLSSKKCDDDTREEMLERAAAGERITHGLVEDAITNSKVSETLVVTGELSGKVSILLADPPWQYDFAETSNRKIENHYPTALPEDIGTHIEAFDIPIADDCVLFMWATSPKLREAFAVMDAWEFTYKTHAVWDKERMGMGYWFRGQHELLMVGTRGKASPPDQEKRCSSVFREKRDSKHSKKPVCVYEAIEAMFPNAVKAEMYQREPREGWVGYGNE